MSTGTVSIKRAAIGSKSKASLAQAAKEYFESHRLSPRSWDAGPKTFFSDHTHDSTKILTVISGSIEFIVGKDRFELQPGDVMNLPRETLHSAVAGGEGVTCMEAFLAD
jgi:quercetin dioxygenase-like cupin family protein